jgi:hypothetical protein
MEVKMKKSIFIIICFIMSIQVFSQDTNIVKFFPLKIGNVWVYSAYSSGTLCSQGTKRRIKVINSIIINSHKYFIVSDTTKITSGGGNCCTGTGYGIDTLRIDSSNGCIYKYSYQGCNYLNHEIMIDSLNARLHDTIKINCRLIIQYGYVCNDTAQHLFFGILHQYRGFRDEFFEGAIDKSFAKDIGIVGYGCHFQYAQGTGTIIGCFVDGILFGDTSFVTGVEQISTEIPKSFSLYQNYPNPFNPSTKIKFSIPAPSPVERVEVRLVIYDALGRELQTLVNEQLQPGTYETEWDGTNYSSGIYYYKLIVGNYTETKKMVLIK